MKPLIVANWKMNPQTLTEAKLLFNLVKRGIKNVKNVEIVVCPPFIYLPILGASARRKTSSGLLTFGSQDCFWEQSGAFTGEVSPLMLKKLGCKYVIVGHSERRTLGETDEMINKKIKAALKVKLKPIFCIGETWEERNKGRAQDVLKKQLASGFKAISKFLIQNPKFPIAYEPVWAIGTGRPCDINEAQTASLFVRKILSKNPRILYGGSVNSKNALAYIKKGGFDGLLIGGASLDAKEFVKIVKNIAEHYAEDEIHR